MINIFEYCKKICPEKIPDHISIKLGKGVDGEVFQFEINKVIKFCKTPNKSYDNLIVVLDYLIKIGHPAYARVYAHTHLFEDVDSQIHFCIMEKLLPISEDEEKVFHTILSHEDRNIKKNYTTLEIKNILSGLSRGLDFEPESVMLLCESIKKSRVVHGDIAPRNIMKDIRGNFKLVDFDRCILI